MAPMKELRACLWSLMLMTGSTLAADYFPLGLGLTWITRTVIYEDDGSSGTLNDTTWIYETGRDDEGHEIFRAKTKTNGGIGYDSVYYYKVGEVVYRRFLDFDGEHMETDEYRTRFWDGMTYTASMVNMDTKDTLARVHIQVKYIGRIATSFSPFDSCFEVTASLVGLPGGSVNVFGPNVGRVKTSAQNSLNRSETELLYFGNGLPVAISYKNAPKVRAAAYATATMNLWNPGRGWGVGSHDLLGRVPRHNNIGPSRIFAVKR